MKTGVSFLFILSALLVPSLVGVIIYHQLRTPIFDAYLNWNSGVIVAVPPNSLADYAGFKANDVLLSVNGVPFSRWLPLAAENYPARVQRGTHRLDLELPLVPLAKINRSSLLIAAIVSLIYWGSGGLLLIRRFEQSGIRLIFLAGNTLALTLLFPMAYPSDFLMPRWGLSISVICLFLSAPLILHNYISFPVRLGHPRWRFYTLSTLYALATAVSLLWLQNPQLGKLVGVIYTLLVVLSAMLVMGYTYLRRANPNERRKLRLVVVSTILAVSPATLYLFQSLIHSPLQIPLWLVGTSTIIAPLGYLSAILRHNLFGIDRLLNRTLVYAGLSLGILLFYLGPFLLIYRLAPQDWLAQAMTAAGLTLIVGLAFERTRQVVQKWVDTLFYGGWYDYPNVVETVSETLARSTERTHLEDVLTRQVPALMNLKSGYLWIGNVAETCPQLTAVPPQFCFQFESETPCQWVVGPRLDGDDFTTADQRILNTLARQAEVALHNVLLIERLRRQLDEIRASREALAQMQRQLLRSREEERARLSRDLHDGPLQTLVGLNMQLGLMAQPFPAGMDGKARSEISDSLTDVRAEVRGLLTELRAVCVELRPPMLDTLGLGAAIHALTEEWAAQYGLSTRLTLPPTADLRSLPGEVAVNLYRVVQEALTNIARHAAAAHVEVTLDGADGWLTLTLRDDGRGFTLPDDPRHLTAQGHFGLVGMRERVALIGGQLLVTSHPGEGTTVRVTWAEG